MTKTFTFIYPLACCMPHTLAHNQVDLWTVWIFLKIHLLVLRVPKERMNR